MSLRIQAKQPTVVNLLSSPEDLTVSPWTLPSVTALSNTELAPDGTYTACKFTYLSTYPTVQYDLSSIVTTGETYTLSVYVKASTGYIAITCYDSWHNFNVGNGYAADGDKFTNVSMTYAANGFYRCSYTFVIPADHTYHNIAFWLGGFNGENWTGQTMTLWGAQLTHSSTLQTYYPASQLNSGVRIQSRQLPGYVDRGLAFYIDAANTASNLTTAIADISGNNYSVGLHNATVTPTAFQVRNTGTAPTQCIVTQFDDGILKATNITGTWTLEAYWKNISFPRDGEAFIVGRIGYHGGIYCYNVDGVRTLIFHAIKTAAGWPGAYNEPIMSVAPGETVHSVMTYNNGLISSYINGVLIKATQWDTSGGMQSYGDGIRIGGQDNDAFPYYGTNSDIYAIRCYNTELTAQEVAQNYQHITQQSRANSGFRIKATAH